MGDALIVNPFSREEVSDAIRVALTMPKAERVRRWESLMSGVCGQDVNHWRDRFVAALDDTGAHGASQLMQTN
jgi:trehalose 6-phosphate synthase